MRAIIALGSVWDTVEVLGYPGSEIPMRKAGKKYVHPITA